MVTNNKDVEFFSKHNSMINIFRNGLTMFEDLDGSHKICKRGLVKIFEYKENLSEEITHKKTSKNLMLTKIMLEPIKVTIDDDECRIDIYRTVKVKGHNCQVSYSESLDAWIIGSRNHFCIMKDKKDLNFINCAKYLLLIIIREVAYILYKIGTYWWEFLERLRIAKKLQDFVVDMRGLTLIGDYVGFNFLIKYPKNTIIFHSMVENDINTHNPTKNILETYYLFKKYDLYTTHVEMPAKNIKSGENYYKKLDHLINKVKSGFVSHQEEGSVIIFIFYFLDFLCCFQK